MNYRRVFFIFAVFFCCQSVFGGEVPEDDLVLWLDAGRGVETSAEGRVFTWKDLSGSDNNAFQKQVKNQPVLKEGAINGKRAVYFDGANTFLEIPGLKIPRDTTVFIVCQDIEQTKGGSIYRPLILADNDPYQKVTDGYGIGYKKAEEPGLSAVLSDGEYWDNFKLTRKASGEFEILMFYKYESDAYFYRNGFRKAHGILNRHTKGPLPFHRGYLLGGWKGPDSTERRYKGMISEVIVYCKALEEAERFRVRQYLSSKYGISSKESPSMNGLCGWLKAESEGKDICDRLKDNSGSSTEILQMGSQFRDVPLVDDAVHGREAFYLRPVDYFEFLIAPEKVKTILVGYYYPLGTELLPEFKVVSFDSGQVGKSAKIAEIKLEKTADNKIRIYSAGELPIGLTEALVYSSELCLSDIEQTKRYLNIRYNVRSDWRYVRNGTFIYESGYSDQPYVTTLSDGSWLCVITTSPDIEASRDRHLVLTRSFDKGRTWTTAVPAIEPPSEHRRPSWATLFTISSGRVYCFYNLVKESGRGVDFCYKYSDDKGYSWSKRYLMPIPELDLDKKFNSVGSWSIDEPEIIDNALYISWTKYGGPDRRGEGFFFRSDNILYEQNADNLRWQMYPEGGEGIHNDDLSHLQEEHNIVPIGGDDIYCVFRTLDGYAGHSYSRDGGKTWTVPCHATYQPGGSNRIKNPRACPRVFRCENGNYLLWYHNHDGRDVEARNKNRDFVWLSGGVLDENGLMHWSQPELVLYGFDFRHNIGMSYPDLIEEGGKYWITETQKITARIHDIDPLILNALWNQHFNSSFTRKGLVFDYREQTGGSQSSLNLDVNLLDGGFTVDTEFRLEKMNEDMFVVDFRDSEGKGFWIKTGSENDIVLNLNDGIHPTQLWSTDPGLIREGQSHHVTFIVDGMADIIAVAVDGILCDGGTHRKYGWSRFSHELGNIGHRGKVDFGSDSSVKIKSLRIYDRAILTSEAVGNYNSVKLRGD